VSPKINPQAVLSRRLEQARERKGLSQKQLGIAAGLDCFVASTRINRSERGVHQPDPVTVQRMADALGVPTAYLFASNERLARMILAFDALFSKAQGRVIAEIERMTGQLRLNCERLMPKQCEPHETPADFATHWTD